MVAVSRPVVTSKANHTFFALSDLIRSVKVHRDLVFPFQNPYISPTVIFPDESMLCHNEGYCPKGMCVGRRSYYSIWTLRVPRIKPLQYFILHHNVSYICVHNLSQARTRSSNSSEGYVSSRHHRIASVAVNLRGGGLVLETKDKALKGGVVASVPLSLSRLRVRRCFFTGLSE